MTGKLVFVVVGIAIIAFIVRLLRGSVNRMVHENTARYQVRKGINFIGYFAAVILVMLVFSDKLGGFTVAFGVAGAGIAFALQEVIASVAGWVAVTLGGFYRVGDRVQLGGIQGDVIDIGVLRTTLMQTGDWVKADLYNGRIVRVANSFVFKEPVFNYSSDFPFLWDEIMVPIAFVSDHKQARAIIEDCANAVVGEYAKSAQHAWAPMTHKYMIEPAIVEPMISMIFNENWMEFTLRYVTDYKKRRSTKDKLFTQILEEINASEGKVSIACATLNIEKHAPIEVHLRRGPAASGNGEQHHQKSL
jgi:small-conductance mechanosensitive channel